MRKLISLTIILTVGVSFVFSAAKNASGKVTKLSTKRMFKLEPMNDFQSSSISTPAQPRTVNNRDGYTAIQVDESKNGYGLYAGSTKPLYLNPEAGLFFVYRQWAGDAGVSGNIGASLCVECRDAEDFDTESSWTTYTNINGAFEIGRYPSALGNEDYPYAFWNEYTGDGVTSYGGRPYYAYDEFGWDGGSFSAPYDIDLAWNEAKDLWVGSPTHDVDANGNDIFNVAYADWTRSDCYVFHSEAYEDGYIAFQTEVKFINETAHLVGGDDEGSYTSQPVLSNMVPVGNEGIGYGAVSAYFSGADTDASVVAGENTHTIIFKQTTDYGASWGPSGLNAGNAYYYIPQSVYEHMMSSGAFPTSWTDPDGCPDSEDLTWSKLFATYDFDIKTDANGDPHIVAGILPSDGDYIYPSQVAENGFWHFTIDKTYLANPGDPQTATGWNYSFVASLSDSWGWNDSGGNSLWQITYPSISISTENPNVMYVVSSKVTEGEFFDPDGDPCTVDQEYDYWTMDNYVMKSTDNGATWWCPWNATNTTWEDAGSDGIPNTNDIDGSEGDGINQSESKENYYDETFAHVASDADDNGTYLAYQMPDFEYGSTTGDLGFADMKQQVYVAYAELTSEPDCSDDGGCGASAGDPNGDGQMNILDIVGIANYILDSSSPLTYVCAADYNGDVTINILDIVGIANCILDPNCGIGNARVVVSGKSTDATFASISRDGKSVNLSANGDIGAVQLTLRHAIDGFSIDLTSNALVAEYNTVGKKTELIIVMPKNSDQELFVAEGDFVITEAFVANSVDYIDVSIADQYAIMSNYPNPFNPQTTVSYELYSDSSIEIAVFNLLGQKVSTLVDGFAEAGSYTSVWNGQDALGKESASGVYILKLTTENQVISNKITLLR